jgi:hypothetical protein
MEGERRRRQVLHKQARELVYKVFSYFKREAESGMPVHDIAHRKNKMLMRATFVLEVCKELLTRATSQFVSLSARPIRLRSCRSL